MVLVLWARQFTERVPYKVAEEDFFLMMKYQESHCVHHCYLYGFMVNQFSMCWYIVWQNRLWNDVTMGNPDKTTEMLFMGLFWSRMAGLWFLWAYSWDLNQFPFLLPCL